GQGHRVPVGEDRTDHHPARRVEDRNLVLDVSELTQPEGGGDSGLRHRHDEEPAGGASSTVAAIPGACRSGGGREWRRSKRSAGGSSARWPTEPCQAPIWSRARAEPRKSKDGSRRGRKALPCRGARGASTRWRSSSSGLYG